MERVVDAGIAASIFVVPLLLGGARAPGQLLLIVLSLTTAGAWLLARCVSREARWNWLGVEPLLLAGVALVVLQITPLPSEVLAVLSPRQKELLTLHGEQGLWPEWRTISMIPSATRAGLVNLCAYCLLFLVTAQRIRSVDDARRILCWVGWAAVGMAILGLLQSASGTEKFLWVVRVPDVSASDVVHGSFVNRNHLAQFLALGAGPLLMLALGEAASASRRGFRSSPASTATYVTRTAAWCGLGCVGLATALSLSRGGALALFTAVAVFLGISYRERLRGGGGLPVLLAIVSAAVALLFLPGGDGVESRVLESVASLDVEQIDQDAARRNIWKAVAMGIADFPLMGAGIGSHRFVYPIYFDHPDDQYEYNTAESGFLQLTLEAGGLGLLLVLIAFAWGISRFLRCAALTSTPGKAGCLAASLAGLAASAVHSGVETPWFMPGCMVLLVPLAACGVALVASGEEGDGPRGIAVHRVTWGSGVAAIVALGVLLVPVKVQAATQEECWKGLAALEPFEEEASRDASRVRSELDRLSALAVDQPRLHLQLAKRYLQVFESLQQTGRNPMSLSDLRQAALAAEFGSAEELRGWLHRATEGHADCLWRAQYHARRCLEVCPLEGQACLYAAELCFLNGAGLERQREYLVQALRVRPYDPQVLFAYGQLEWQAGHSERTFALWKEAYHRSRYWEQRITDQLINALPAEEFLRIFEPDWLALRDLRNRMSESQHPEYAVVGRKFAEAAVARSREIEDGGHQLLLDACVVYEEIGDDAAALECAQAAVSRHSNFYDARFATARLLHRQERYSEALPHLKWCLSRRPSDQQAVALLKSAMEGGAWQNPPLADASNRVVPVSGTTLSLELNEKLSESEIFFDSYGTDADRNGRGLNLRAESPRAYPRKD